MTECKLNLTATTQQIKIMQKKTSFYRKELYRFLKKQIFVYGINKVGEAKLTKSK